MVDTADIIELSSSPSQSPRSALTEVPITIKTVSEMCYDSDGAKAENYYHYHAISESDDEGSIESENYDDPKECQYNSPKKVNENFVLNFSPPKQSPNSKKSKISKSEKNRMKEIKAKEKAEKVKEKFERAALLERIQQSKPGQCMKYVTVIFDENILTTDVGTKAIELFKDVEFKYKIETQRDPFSITWRREDLNNHLVSSDEKHILLLWSCNKLVTSVKYCTLVETFRELKARYNGFRIFFVIYGYSEYFRKQTRKKIDDGSCSINGGAIRKRRRTLEISKEQIEMSLTELEVILKISTRFLNNHHELSILVQQVTKAIAEIPHRKEVEKRDMEKCWYARGDSRDCVKIDKDFNGLFRLWLQQLSQFNKSSLDIAKSIADIYPSPYSLYQVYQNLSTEKEKELLLQDIQIKKGNSSSRRIGPELSRKISLLFSQENGEIYLSQE